MNTISTPLDDDVLFEFRYDFPGWPQVTRGRANVVALHSGYGSNIRLDRGDSLIVHPLRRTALDYGVHGKVLATDAPYDFVSIVTIENRKKQTIISKLRLSMLDHDARSPERHWSPTNRFC